MQLLILASAGIRIMENLIWNKMQLILAIQAGLSSNVDDSKPKQVL